MLNYACATVAGDNTSQRRCCREHQQGRNDNATENTNKGKKAMLGTPTTAKKNHS